ncbi:MAG: respiratory nitrate reductase subunit gamma, partial [Betaproteobacteria bacterium]
METASVPSAGTNTRTGWLAAVGFMALLLLGGGLAGRLSAAPGYALFAAAGFLLASGTGVFAVFTLTRRGETRALQRAFTLLLYAGAAVYVLCVCALAGYYIHETLQGRMEWRWIIFGPTILGALIVLDYGLYRKLVRNNLPTWRRYRRYVSREQSNPGAMRRVLVDEVILHRSLFRTSKIRWLRHALIFWGFMVMFAAELAAVVVRDGFPAFGWRDIWREPGHPVTLTFGFVFDFTGVMIVAGCLLALGWRVAVNARPERRYSDTPTTVFLLFVVLTGFVVEGLRILPTLDDPVNRAEFAGLAAAHLFARAGVAGTSSYQPWWFTHVIAACVFIAYVPVMRLIHSCATPLGRLAHSQKEMLAAKKMGVLGAMLRPNQPRPS